MYTAFFGLNEKPFAITPDPRYLFMSERHGEGLAHLVYGVTESGGFIQLTGEVGTGKTTLVRTLLGQMPTEVNVALVLNPQLTAVEFLLAICEELGVDLPADRTSSKALVDALNKHLLETHANGRRTILLVDEAQNLSEDVLEQVRLLTNLETAKQKLLQIILIGQEELRELLAQNNLRQLAQRVTGRYHLQPLSRDEMVKYIEHRLRVAGALTEIFDPAAKRMVYKLSGGIPRLANVICDRALLGAYSVGSRTVTPAIVRRAAREVSGEELPRRSLAWPVAAAVSVLLAIAATWFLARYTAPAVTPAVAMSSAAITATPETRSRPVTMADTGMDNFTAAPVNEPDTQFESAAAPDAADAVPSLVVTLGNSSSTLETAMRELFNIWQLEYRPAAGTACSQAEALGLTCLFQRGTWNMLRQLNHPAILTLVDDNGDNHYPVVAAIEGERAELIVGDAREWFGVADIAKLWFGQYLLLWQPPNGQLVSLQPGSRGAAVSWLRSSLAAIDSRYASATDTPELFDESLETALKEFQRSNRLQVDGVAGQQTQILINSLLGDENTPLLATVSQ